MQQRKVSIADAARIIGEPDTTVNMWRHRKVGGFAKLGELTPAGTVVVSLHDVALMALTSMIFRQGRSVEDAGQTAAAWAQALDDVYLGRHATPPGESVYAVELRDGAGQVLDRFVAAGKAALKKAIKLAYGSPAVSILNLSELAARTQTGWLIAVEGVEVARASLEQRIADLPADARAAALGYFDALAARIAPPKPARAPRPPKPQMPQIVPTLVAAKEKERLQ